MIIIKAIFYTFIIFLFSCNTLINKYEIKEYKFIEKILNNPDSLISVIDNGSYYNKKARNNWLIDDTLNSYIPYIKELGNNGFEYTHFARWFQMDYDNDEIFYYEEVQIKGINNDLYLNLIFVTNNNKLTLDNLSRGKMTHQELYEEFTGHPLKKFE